MTLPVTTLVPNAYSPNTMTEAAFAELVVEVRHLGRLPKAVRATPKIHMREDIGRIPKATESEEAI